MSKKKNHDKSLASVKVWDKDLEWWQRTVIYQIYPRSFKDSTGNGVGDIPGIISKLDYFEYLGIETIWLSPVYPSPMKDHGYDVSNYTDIDPLFGTLQDFDDLVAGIRRRKMKLVLDFIPSHSSDQHEWFKESRRGGGEDNPLVDYYIWDEGTVDEHGTRQAPSNKTAIFGGPVWTWDDERRAFFYHRFLPEQPDLNWANKDVQQELMAVFKFWLDRGVDGFRIDAMRHSDEAYAIVQQWRDFFEEYEKKNNKEHIFMVVEMYDETLLHSMKFYDTGADGPFNFNLLGLNSSMDGQAIHRSVRHWFEKMPDGKWPNWVVGNHDQSRIATKVGVRNVDALNLLLLLLPGTPTVYAGDEIGMENVDVSWDQTQDPWALNMGEADYKSVSRDFCRAPLSWSDGKNAGFSDAESTWLPIDPKYKQKNIQAQMAAENSSLQVFRAAVKLRNLPAFQRGSMDVLPISGSDKHPGIFAFIRHLPRSGTDTGKDTGRDTGITTGRETEKDTGRDTNTGKKTGTSTGKETGRDTVTNTGKDTGREIGTATGRVTATGKETGMATATGNDTDTATATVKDLDPLTELQLGVYIVAMNIGVKEQLCDLTKHVKKEVFGSGGSCTGTLVLASSGSIYQKEQSVDLRHVKLRAGDSVVIQVIPRSHSMASEGWWKCTVL